MTESLLLGDVVTLKSGGLPMTVVDCIGEQRVVAWQDKQGRMHKDQFHHDCLRRSAGEFDGMDNLIIEGVTHSREEIDAYLETAGNA